MSSASQLSTRRVDDIRLRALRFFNADPDEFDLVFVANATAAIKLVAEVLRDSAPHGFWYAYHSDAHTSLVGVRELADRGSRCFGTDGEVDAWISELEVQDNVAVRDMPQLFAYPAQSNMNGRRLPRWCEDIRRASRSGGNDHVFTLLDAASLVATSPLHLGNASTAPDFTALSFYKVFGFPDLGALIVRKDAGHVFAQRRYFGGGTVDLVSTREIQWHAKKASFIHELLEDGTLPFHSIIALRSAFDTHERLYGSMDNISSHTRFLARRLYDQLSSLTHPNGTRVCQLYSHYDDPRTQGPIVAFNLRSSDGAWIGKTEVEKLASVKEIQIRSGSLCNPGGTASSLGWTGTDLRRLHASGLRCDDDHDILDDRPTGMLRVSLGAMTSVKDIDTFLGFVDEFYVEKSVDFTALPPSLPLPRLQPGFSIESISVYPIKSCGAFKVPDGQRWKVRREGLAWDREWCLVHQGTGAALNQKRYPRMALIQPFIDLDHQVLRISCPSSQKSLEISLVHEDTNPVPALCQTAMVCGNRVALQAYSSSKVSTFFSDFLGVPCTLARLSLQPSTSARVSSPSLDTMPGSFPQLLPTPAPTPARLSNESPILLISRSSVNRLNDTIKANSTGTKKAIAADVFRSNIVVVENTATNPRASVEQPYIEDTWTELSIGPSQLHFDVLGSCQRCQMVCIDQVTGVRGDEPLSTLAKTRRFAGKTYFGVHVGLADGPADGSGVMVGDIVLTGV